MTDKVLISEVGPRDGLQNCKGVMPTAIKKRWIKGLYDAGVRKLGVDAVTYPLSASETHSIKNLRQTHDQVIENVKSIRTLFDGVSVEKRPRFETALSTYSGLRNC